MEKKLKYSSEYLDLYNELWMGQTKEQQNKSEGFFKDKKDIYIFCLILGVRNKVLKPLIINEKYRVIPIDANFDDYKDILYSSAIFYHKNIEILKKDKEIDGYSLEKTLNELANGGAEILKEKLLKSGKSIVENFENLLEEEIDELKTKKKVENTLLNIFK